MLWRWTPLAWLAIGCSSATTGPDQTTPTDAPTSTITDPVADCAARVTASEVVDTTTITALELALELSEPAAVWAVCTAEGDPAEQLLVEAGAVVGSHRLDLVGLLPATTYTCEVHPACADSESTPVSVEVPALPGGVPTLTATGTPSAPFHAFNAQGGFALSDRQLVLVADDLGRVRWGYNLGVGYRADVDVTWTGTGMHMGGGWGLFEENIEQRGLMLEVALDGTVRFDHRSPLYGIGYNHHSEPMPDGTVLSLTTSRDEGDGRSWHGVAVERRDPLSDELTWSWSSQAMFDAGQVQAQGNNSSPWHANSVRWRTDSLGDALWVSLYVGQAMWRIDRDTGLRTHELTASGGDFTWQDADGNPLPPEERVYAQHDPDYTTDGRVLLYDNGVDRPGGNQSRVVELELDLEENVATLLWSWTEEDWYTQILGDADYLPSGNVLVTKGVVRILDFFGDQPSALIEVSPTTDEVAWRLELEEGFTVFRAQQIGGCDIFAHAGYCPEVADRIATLTALSGD